MELYELPNENNNYLKDHFAELIEAYNDPIVRDFMRIDKEDIIKEIIAIAKEWYWLI